MGCRFAARARPALFLAALLAAAACAAAEREAEVLVVRFTGGPSEERFRYMDLPAAVRFLSPVAFTAKGGALRFESVSSSGLAERGRRTLAGRPGGSLESVAVLTEDRGGAPRPSRTATISFTLDELIAKGGAWSGVPAAWACWRAASESGWTSGSVWARSVSYDPGRGRITVKVGLSKK